MLSAVSGSSTLAPRMLISRIDGRSLRSPSALPNGGASVPVSTLNGVPSLRIVAGQRQAAEPARQAMGVCQCERVGSVEAAVLLQIDVGQSLDLGSLFVLPDGRRGEIGAGIEGLAESVRPAEEALPHDLLEAQLRRIEIGARAVSHLPDRKESGVRAPEVDRAGFRGYAVDAPGAVRARVPDQLPHAAAGVRRRDFEIARQLLFDLQRVLLHVGRDQVGVEQVERGPRVRPAHVETPQRL